MKDPNKQQRMRIINESEESEWRPNYGQDNPGFWEKNKQRLQGAAALTVIGLVLTFFQDIIPYHLYFLEKESKTLQVVVLSSTSLVQVADSISKDIKIEYKNEQIKNLSLITVKLEHNGNTPIRPEDYAHPIAFQFPQGSEILEAKIVQSEPSDLRMSIISTAYTSTLSTELLNPGERVVIQFILANVPLENPYWTVNARIAGLTGQIPIVTAIQESGQVQNDKQSGLSSLGKVAVALGVLVVLALLGMAIVRMLRGR